MSETIQSAFKTTFARHRHLVVIAVVYSLAVFATSKVFGLEQLHSWIITPDLTFLALGVSGFALFIGYSIYWPLVEKERLPVTRAIKAIGQFLTTPEHWMSFLLVFAVFVVFTSAFTPFKMMIPSIHPYSFDELFMNWDRALHFGVDPWRITHALFGGPVGTLFLALVYVMWFFVMWFVFLWRMLDYDHAAERDQFLTCYFVAWIIIGTFAALGFSSGGPVYYGELVSGPNPFEELMARIYTIHTGWVEQGGFWEIWTVNAQEMLWSRYISEEPGVGAGISAMPSMHVAVSVLLALTVWQRSKFFGWIMIVFATLIQLSAVHVGWHYAIDGYVAAFMMIAIWKIVERFTRV